MINTSTAVCRVTGCSSGFGKALAKQLADAGTPVAATARRLQRLTWLRDDARNVLKAVLDVADPGGARDRWSPGAGLPSTADIRGYIVTLLVLVTTFMAGGFNGSAVAQSSADTDNVEIVVANLPKIKERLLPIMTGQAGISKIATLSSAEVWSVPRALVSRISSEVSALGCIVMEMSPDGAQIAYRVQTSSDLTEQQRAAILRLSSIDATTTVGAIALPPNPMIEYVFTRSDVAPSDDEWQIPQGKGSRLRLPLPSGDHVTITRTRPLLHFEEGLTWIGEVEKTGERAILMLARSGGISGYFGHNGRIYRIDEDSSGIHTIAEIDPVKLPPDHSPSAADLVTHGGHRPQVPEPKVQPLPDDERVALESKKVTIDVLLLFTRSVVQRYLAKPSQWSALASATANEVFRNSGLGNISVRIVHHEVVDYDETGAEHFDHLYRMVDGLGVFSGLRKLRDSKRADIVGLVLHSPTGCGQATRVGADADEAFFVAHHACAAITYTIPHEIGHILGARHDRTFDATPSPFPFAHGYVNGSKWRTIMSYQQTCNGCPRIPFFSNPRILYGGEPTGTLATDNARMILQQAERVSQFR